MKCRWLLLDYVDPKHEQTAQGARPLARSNRRRVKESKSKSKSRRDFSPAMDVRRSPEDAGPGTSRLADAPWQNPGPFNGTVGFEDLLSVITQWGKCEPAKN